MSKYFTADNLNNIEISDDVIISLAAMAASEVEGVVPSTIKTTGIDLKEIVSKKSLSKAVTVNEAEGKIAIEINITVEYGKPIAEISRNVQKSVFDAVTDSTGLTVSAVNVIVAGIGFPKEEK